MKGMKIVSFSSFFCNHPLISQIRSEEGEGYLFFSFPNFGIISSFSIKGQGIKNSPGFRRREGHPPRNVRTKNLLNFKLKRVNFVFIQKPPFFAICTNVWLFMSTTSTWVYLYHKLSQKHYSALFTFSLRGLDAKFIVGGCAIKGALFIAPPPPFSPLFCIIKPCHIFALGWPSFSSPAN